jgi:hypothetical protein
VEFQGDGIAHDAGVRAGTMHTPQCTVPETGEREGPAVMACMCDKICGHLELFGVRHGAARWNEKVRIDPEKLPPRASRDEPHCRWRIRLTDARVDYAADPGDFVRDHGLARETDAQIVNEEAGSTPERVTYLDRWSAPRAVRSTRE